MLTFKGGYKKLFVTITNHMIHHLRHGLHCGWPLLAWPILFSLLILRTLNSCCFDRSFSQHYGKFLRKSQDENLFYSMSKLNHIALDYTSLLLFCRLWSAPCSTYMIVMLQRRVLRRRRHPRYWCWFAIVWPRYPDATLEPLIKNSEARKRLWRTGPALTQRWWRTTLVSERWLYVCVLPNTNARNDVRPPLLDSAQKSIGECEW